MAETIKIAGELESTATGNVVAAASAIKDKVKNKYQSQINQETDAAIQAETERATAQENNRYTKSETYNKTELNNMITTPNQEYVTVNAYASLPVTGSANTIYRVSNYDGSQNQVDPTKYSEYAWNGTQYVFLSVKTQIGEVFDISEYHSGAVYTDLANALGTSGVNVPSSIRRGGMSVKFKQLVSPASYTVEKTEGLDSQPTGTEISTDPHIDSGTYNESQLSAFSTLPESTGAGNAVTYWMEVAGDTTTYTSWVITMVQSSDNKYVQYRLMKNEWSIDTEDWAIAEEGVYVKNLEFVYVKTDSEGKILWAIKKDGDIYYGAGVPQQVKDYIQEKISELSLDEYEDIVNFLGDIIEGDKTLTTLLSEISTALAEKVDKEQGKSLINSEYAETIKYDENPEYIDVLTDSNGKLLIGIKKDGQLVFGTGVPQVIVDYINQKFNDLGLTNYPNVVTFLGNLIYGDKNLQTLLSEIGTFSTDIVRNQATYNIEEGQGISTVSNPLLLPLRKGNKLRLRTEGNSMSLYPNGYPLILYYIIDSSNRIRFTHLYDSNWHEYEIPADAIGIGIYLTHALLQDATITLYLEEYSGDKYEHEKMYSEDSQFNLLPAIPSYYFTNNYLDNKVDVINSAIRNCSTDCDTFIWITDVHWERWANAGHSPSLIKYIMDRTAVSRVLGGGDYLNGYLNDGMDIYDFMNKMRQAIGSDKFYTAYGNHEFIQNDSYKDIFYGLRQRLDDVVYGDANKTYFYFDDSLTKTRYIALGSFGYRPSGGSYTSLYDSTQLSWFTGTALNVQSGWTIIIFTHSLYAIAGDDYHLIVQSLNGAQDFINAIDNYNGNGTIACVLIGHTHVDRIHQNENGVPYIISACDRYEQNVLNGGYELILPKTLGTKNEQHFEVVVVDHQNRSIKLIAIGSPSLDGTENNIGSEVEIREVTY